MTKREPIVQADTEGEITKWFLESQDHNRRDLIVNAVTHGGVTPLMLATKLNNAKAVNQLMNADANPFLVDQLRHEAIDYQVSMLHDTEKCYPITVMINMAKEQWKK